MARKYEADPRANDAAAAEAKAQATRRFTGDLRPKDRPAQSPSTWTVTEPNGQARTADVTEWSTNVF